MKFVCFFGLTALVGDFFFFKNYYFATGFRGQVDFFFKSQQRVELLLLLFYFFKRLPCPPPHRISNGAPLIIHNKCECLPYHEVINNFMAVHCCSM